MKTSKYEMDMCHGPLLKKILIFGIPLMLSGMFQLLFNAADIMVVGRFVGSEALAAVGSTTSLVNLMVNLFVGFSVGVNMLVSRYYGAGKDEDVNQTIHTAITLALIFGVILALTGGSLAPVFLGWMGTPEDVMELASLYLRIYFMGMPVIMTYNFGSAILRSVGDTRRPLYFLTLAGFINVGLNLFFVLVCRIGVAGVALATILSQVVSVALVLRCLVKAEGCLHLEFKKLGIHREKMKLIARAGLPAGFQSCVFSFSNVVIQSSVNSFGSLVMAGNSAAFNIESFIYQALNSFHHAALCFTSQNLGGGQQKRIGLVLRDCLFLVTAVGLALGLGAVAAGDRLIGLYSSDPEVIRYGVLRMMLVCPGYFLCGTMDTMVGAIRGLGYSVMPMIVSILGACGLRILWIMTAFARFQTLHVLYLCYVVSWGVTTAVHLICYWYVRTRRKQS